MIEFRQKEFTKKKKSRKQSAKDEDFLKDLEIDKRDEHAGRVASGTLSGILLGGGAGAGLGALTKNPAGIIIGSGVGAVGGGIVGNRLGKKSAKRSDEEYARRQERFRKSGRKDRDYLISRYEREKQEREERRREKEREERADRRNQVLADAIRNR